MNYTFSILRMPIRPSVRSTLSSMHFSRVRTPIAFPSKQIPSLYTLKSNSVSYYSTFNAKSNSGDFSDQRKKKLGLWPRIKAFASFTVSGALVIGASGLAGLVIYLIVSELFSPSGDTVMFNRAVSTVEADPNARKLLKCEDTENSKERLKAYGELLTDDKWTRNRPISSTRRRGKDGKEHHYMRFHVESKQKLGLIHIEARESDKNYTPDIISMYMDVPGEKRYYFVKPQLSLKQPQKGFLGVKWGPKKE